MKKTILTMMTLSMPFSICEGELGSAGFEGEITAHIIYFEPSIEPRNSKSIEPRNSKYVRALAEIWSFSKVAPAVDANYVFFIGPSIFAHFKVANGDLRPSVNVAYPKVAFITVQFSAS